MRQSPLPIFVISGKDPTVSPGGYAAYSHNLCAILTQLGHPVHVLAAGQAHGVKHTPIGAVHLVPNGTARLFPVLGSVEMAMLPFYAQSFAKEIFAVVKEMGYADILVWGMGPWAFTGFLVKRSYRPTKIFASYFTTFRHEMGGSLESILTPDYSVLTKIKYLLIHAIGGIIFSSMEKRTLAATDMVVTHYRSTENILRQEFSVGPEKMKRISYYIEVFERTKSSLYHPETERRTFPKPIILSVCRQDARKGINFLLHAVQILNSRNRACSLVIVGSGSLLAAHKKLAQKLRLNNVYFLGYQAKIDDLYRQADVFVLSSTEEGSGSLSLLEAMREGLPIVSTDRDGLSEDVKHHVSALMVQSASPTSLADAINDLLLHRVLAKRLALEAKSTYQKKFSFEKMKRDVKRLITAI